MQRTGSNNRFTGLITGLGGNIIGFVQNLSPIKQCCDAKIKAKFALLYSFFERSFSQDFTEEFK
ncbi:hypothetical protein ACTAZI_17640 [Legionella bozemanae]